MQHKNHIFEKLDKKPPLLSLEAKSPQELRFLCREKEEKEVEEWKK